MKRLALLVITLAVLATGATAVYALITFVKNSNHERACSNYRTLLKAAWAPGWGGLLDMHAGGASRGHQPARRARPQETQQLD